jgi:hypothetical protein
MKSVEDCTQEADAMVLAGTESIENMVVYSSFSDHSTLKAALLHELPVHM